MKHKVSELEGALLDEAVFQSLEPAMAGGYGPHPSRLTNGDILIDAIYSVARKSFSPSSSDHEIEEAQIKGELP